MSIGAKESNRQNTPDGLTTLHFSRTGGAYFVPNACVYEATPRSSEQTLVLFYFKLKTIFTRAHKKKSTATRSFQVRRPARIHSVGTIARCFLLLLLLLLLFFYLVRYIGLLFSYGNSVAARRQPKAVTLSTRL